MNLAQFFLLVAYAGGMGVGQLLLKQGSAALRDLPHAQAAPLAWSIATNPWLLAGLALYAGLTVLWVWILSFTPLSLAYPFVGLAIGITPLLAHFVFAEPIAMHQLVGLAIVLVGLIVMGRPW